MTNGAHELTVKEIADSAIVRRLSRVISIILLPVLGGVWGYFAVIEHRVTTIEQDRAARITQNDVASKMLNSTVLALQSDVNSVKIDVAAQRVDIATIRGILQQMQHDNDVAFNNSKGHIWAVKPDPSPP